MVKVSAALRERLMAQKKSMSKGGMLIRNKGFTRMKLRVLPPREGELPGVENTSYFSKTLNKGSTSPVSWGIPCPVTDALDRIYREGSKEDKDGAKAFCRRTVEYWIPVIDRSDEGTPQNPKLRILQGKQSVYQKICDWMLDEEDSDDITDPMEGRDLVVKKVGSGLDTEWSVDKADKSPISEDEDMATAWVELSTTFDPRTRFYIPKLEVLQEMYKGLTGEKIPKSYLDPITELIAELEAGGHVSPDEDGDDTTTTTTETAETTEAAEETTEEAVEETTEGDENDLTGSTVQFDNEGTIVQGRVLGQDPDDANNWLVVEDGGDENEPWAIPAEMLTLVEEEAEEAEAPPPIVKKKVLAAPAKAATATKPAAAAPKPGASKTSIPAGKAATTVTKPAAAPAKAATKPAAAPAKPATTTAAKSPAGLPRKPGAAAAPTKAATPSASSSIKDRLRKQPKK